MTRMVNCRKYNQEKPGLDRPPYPGAKGEEIFNTVSKQAWAEWLSLQTMLINEKHLNMMEPDARAFLQDELEKFLNDEETTKIEGYVPPSK